MSAAEDALDLQVFAAGLPAPEREYRFMLPRRWRFDFWWGEQRLAVEVEGGVYQGGRHTRGAGFEADCAKYNAATLAGIRVLRVTPTHIESGEALRWIEQALAQEEGRDGTPTVRGEEARAV